MKKVVLAGALVVSAAAATATAQPYYAKGDYNGWSSANMLTLVAGDHYSTIVTGLNPGDRHEFKGANDDWSFNGPFDGNVQARADANGEIEVHFYATNSHGDGWLPEGMPRTGFTDTNLTGWEIMGDFNGWSAAVATFADIGGGIMEASWAATAGNHEFKARRTGDWDVGIGNEFAGSGANIQFDIGAGGGTYTMRIDTAGGRYQLVPAPASLALLGLGGLAIRRRR